MRWGVPEQASNNHSTTDLCINEIQKCKQVSAGPNFVVSKMLTLRKVSEIQSKSILMCTLQAIVGNKYGYRPIPNAIRQDVFEAMRDLVSEESDWSLVTEWYKCDENAQPPEYILQNINSKIANYSSVSNIVIFSVVL